MEIPYTVNPRRDTGLFNAKVGIWLFLASEVMLFGGLFSAYIFLRTGVREGVDIPWPNGLDVHGWMYWIGFINTLILIASSVFVVMAWAQLKLRNYGKYQLYMAGVLICSALFMVNKGYEYNSKLNHHFGIYLTDGTLLDGALVKDEKHGIKGDEIVFQADEVDFALVGTGVFGKADPYFLDFAENKDLTYDIQLFKAESADGKLEFVEGEMKSGLSADLIPGVLDVHIAELEKAAAADAVERKKALKQKIREAEGAAKIALQRELALLRPIKIPGKVVGKPSEPANYVFKRKEILGGKPGKESIAFFRGNGLRGTLVDDTVDIEVHTIDLQMVAVDTESMAWGNDIWSHGEGEAMKEGYLHHKAEAEEHYREFIQQGYFPADKIYRWHHAHAAHSKAETGGEDSHSEYSVVSVPGDQVRRMGNHGPKFGPYYAIYFTMTALHGLHVVGGAIVLGYFLFFGRKLYKKNPEHLANRVEVGGLFWHFVDLVWIFLFPLYYLL
tara:strand:+ start:8674 stop:10173 length:1500 start_codon:yes stop_codon:yes gene_type:complete